MAKKSNWSDFFKGLGSFVTGDFLTGVSSTMKKTFEEAEKKVERATARAIKASVVFLMMLVGFIFLLVGLSHYLTSIWTLKPGAGYLIVGGVLFVLGWFGKLIRA